MIFALIPASLLTAVWLIFLFAVEEKDWIYAAKGKLLTNRLQIEELKKKDRENKLKLQNYSGFSAKFMKLIIDGGEEKKIRKLLQENKKLQNGDLKSVSTLEMPGYAMLRKFEGIRTSGAYRKVRSVYFELYGKKHPELLTRRLFAQMLSYPLIGVAATLAVGSIVIVLGATTAGIGVIGIGSLLVLVLVYAMYDEISDRANKRRDEIARQFPNVVSKLALLVTAGMIMNRAWIETAESGEGELYVQMRKTAEEMDNLIRPEIAYSAFIDRCNTKETTKLASAIMQNMSKGNSEIAVLLRQMSAEAWNERRNLAKRDSEAANSKLMVPTMLLFGSVMIMIMVPVVMSFSGL